MTESYVVVGIHSWSRQAFDKHISGLPGNWSLVSQRQDLDLARLRAISPRYIFFFHWSWKVPVEILQEYECIGFHMADLPYGRGGTPLQNLILRGHKETMLSAFRLADEMDAGPIYLKENLSLEGSAENIYLRASLLAAQMVRRILEENPQPVPQEGEPTVFQRRKPADSELTGVEGLQALYDGIRMVDAEGYPRAFVEHGGFRYQFSNARLTDGYVEANVIIKPVEPDRS